MGERLTLKEIARHAKVSLATASLVVRSSPLVAAETRERVLSCINELGYVYDRTAAKLRTRLTHTIGLIVCEITNPFYAELTAGIDDVLDRAGWVAFLANTAESPSRQDRFIERMREHRVDGLLLSPAEGSTPELAERLTRLGIPVVQVLRRLGTRPANRVSANFRLGTTLAIEHLIRLGHKRIAFVGGGRRVSPARDRAAAYRETLARYGLPIGPVVNCRPTREDGARAVVELMRGTPTDPTAILCYNDICAFGVMVALTDLGVSVGSDCAVIGFDDIAEAAHYRPTLTTVNIGARSIGEEAAQLLLRRIKAPDGPPENVVLPPRLIVRASCGGQDVKTDEPVPHLNKPA